MGWRAFRGGGGRMVEKSGSLVLLALGGRGVNVWSKGGERTKMLASGNQKAVASKTHNNLQPLLAQNSVLPLGGCGGELALRLCLAFGTGLLCHSNVRSMRGSLIGAAKPKQHRKPLQPRTSERIPVRNRKISARLPSPISPPFGSV